MPFKGFLENPRRINFQIEEQEYQDILLIAKEKAMPLSFIIRQAIQEFVQRSKTSISPK
jgi:hypothetical protein